MGGQLYACPFCRQMFTGGEVRACPECDILVRPLDELPPSHEAQLLEAEAENRLAPEDEPLPFYYMGRNRGALLLMCAVGIALFFAPWLHELTPEDHTWSGYEFAQRLPWLWAGGVAWFIMLALVLSRRTIRQMRGARLAVGLLALMVTVTVALRLGISPTQYKYVRLTYTWGWGLYTAGFVSLLAIGLAWRFGGSVVDMPTKETRRGDETLH